MDRLGDRIRKLREENKLPLRTVAAYLDIDQAILSKMERGLRSANRQQIVKLAAYFKVSESDLLVSWLSDKLVYELADEELALKALQVAEEKVNYRQQTEAHHSETIRLIKNVLKEDGRVAAAWLFGSFARGEEKLNSDVDILVEMDGRKKYSLFDLLDIAHGIEEKINRKVDLVEKGYLKDFAEKSARENFIKIYG